MSSWSSSSNRLLHIYFSRLYADSCVQLHHMSVLPARWRDQTRLPPGQRQQHRHFQCHGKCRPYNSLALINDSSQCRHKRHRLRQHVVPCERYDTYMNPNSNYAHWQGAFGPGRPLKKAHTGVLDLKCMVKVVNTVLVLCGVNAPEWTGKIDPGLSPGPSRTSDVVAHSIS